MQIELRRFMPIDPGDLLQGSYGEWIILIMLCGLFVALAGAVLPDRLTKKPTGKALYTIIGIMLGVGLFMAKKTLNFNLESFGFLAVGLIIILAMFVTYGLSKLGMRKDLAMSFSYCLIFLTFYFMTPSLYDTIAQTLPILNLLLFIAFLYLLFNLLINMMRRQKGPIDAARKLARNRDTAQDKADTEQIDNEIQDEETEGKLIKTRTLKLTQNELASIHKTMHYLEEIQDVLKDHQNLTNLQKSHIIETLRRMGNLRSDFENKLKILKNHVEKYSEIDEHLIAQLKNRFHKTTDKNKKREILKEYEFEKRKLDILDFVKNHHGKVYNFMRIFDAHIDTAARLMQQGNCDNARSSLASAHAILDKTRHLLRMIKKYEKYIYKLSQKEVAFQKSEKKGK